MDNIYIYDTHTLYVENNELHLINDKQTIVINIDTFIHDLPSIIQLCKQDQKKRLKKSLKERINL